MILWVDNIPERAAIAYQRMSPKKRDGVMWCRTVAEGISVLEDPNYIGELTEVHMDHDFDGDYYQRLSDPTCGSEIVRFVEKSGAEKYKHIVFVVHTHNLYAGNKMAIKLLDMGLKVDFIPFGEQNARTTT